MQFKTFVLGAFVASATSVVAADAESCAAGALLGIFAVCGTNPVDCGSFKCCLAGQKCVTSGEDFKCEDPNLQPSTTVTVNAACYGTPTASGSASPTVSKTSSSAPPPPSGSASASATPGPSQGGGDYGSETSSSKAPSPTGGFYPITNGTTGSGVAPPSGTVSSGPVIATANAGLSSFSTSTSNLAALLSAMGFLAYWL